MKVQTEKKVRRTKPQKMKKNKNKPVDISTLSVDDFMSGEWPSDESGDDASNITNGSTVRLKKKKQLNRLVNEEKDGTQSGIREGGMNQSESVSDGDEEDDEDDSLALDSYSHKKSLEKLRKTDPDFYKFLSENDKQLLEFNVSSESDGETDEEDKIHEPPEKLEVGSDESDYEGESDKAQKGSGVITLKMVNHWQEQLQTDKSMGTIKHVVKAFHAALMRVSSDEDQGTSTYKVGGSSVFNAVIQLCVLELQPAIKRFLKLPASGSGHSPLYKCKRWPKIKGIIKFYLTNVIKFLTGVSSTHILGVLLKHLHQMIPFVACFPQITRPVLKKLVQMWASGEETVRVIAFLCILRLTIHQQKEVLDTVLKLMYMAYVRNSKFVSPSTLPVINFMRHSVAEIFAMDPAASYRHVFLYIRQLAIHLRNAITLHKKESIQTVYNWQFIHSLHLWAELLGITANAPQLQPLIYPLVQIIIGTIKLLPTARYFPLRFHCIQILIELSRNTSTFIPILPYLIEVFETFDFNRRHTKVSMKPMNFTCILRLSKTQLQENGSKDAVIEKIYELILEYLTDESHKIAFPELVCPAKVQLKIFVKNCKVGNYCKKIRQVLDKIEENAKAIEKERKNYSYAVGDKAVDAWETNMKLKGTPLMKFYESWRKVHERQVAKQLTENDKLGDFELPVLKKRPRNTSESEPEGPVELFPSDESDTDNLFDSEDGEEPKKKRGKRGSKGKKHQQEKNKTAFESDDDQNAADIIQELRLSDLE